MPKLSRFTRHAFTLIELLIVVAIIAILAAIAVPNFLEAQTRSKVSRVKADMRSVATAMEAYAVDHNRYATPSDSDGGLIDNPPAAVDVSPFETRVPLLLTTPVAYITSRPHDPFASARNDGSRIYHCTTHDYVRLRAQVSPQHDWLHVYHEFFEQVTGADPPSAVLYFMVSFGPDGKHDADVPHAGHDDHDDDEEEHHDHEHGAGALYDPTNGTLSRGDILYFGPGLGFWRQ